ncbi:MAG: FAD-binding protein [Thermoleophilaceae bacterium]
MRIVRRARWRNHTGNQGVDPLQRQNPQRLDELAKLIRQAESEGVSVRAVGSGHSWSDVALTPGFLVEPQGMSALLELSELRAGVDAAELVRCEGGMRLEELNAALHASGRALHQMGGYDGQTVAGVVATSTHGSGIGLGPICDFVRSFDLVAAGGVVHRVEPADGPTDPVAYAARYPDAVLHQDDAFFDAALVGMGCLGVMHSAMLSVRERYWLKEVRTLQPWGEVKAGLVDALAAHRHYEVLVNPYRPRDSDLCLVTTRDIVDGPAKRPRDRARNSFPEFVASLPLTGSILNVVSDLWPRGTPRRLDQGLKLIADEDFTNWSYKVLNVGTANFLPAYCSEIGVPFDSRGLWIEAVERIMRIADRAARLGDVYQTSWASLRFVRESRACLSMMEGRPTMMIELIQATRTEGGFELLAAYEDALYDLEGRPHWGQVNTLTPERVRSLYPRLPEWMAVHARLNASGVFDGPFPKRVGLSAES